MTTRDHLVYRMQEQYAFLRDYLPLLDAMRHEAGDQRLAQLLAQQHEAIRGEMETLERGMSLLGAHIRLDHNPLAPALKEARSRFKQQMNPAREQLDIYALLTLQDLARSLGAGYEANIELARAIGEGDVAKVLEENAQRQQEGYIMVRALMTTLVQEISRAEARRAA